MAFSPPRTQACHACAKAKRKCGRQSPSYLRCMERAVECAYPVVKAGSFVLLEQEESEGVTHESNAEAFSQESFTVSRNYEPFFDLNFLNTPIAPLPQLDSIWLTAPETWMEQYPTQVDFDAFEADSLKKLVVTARQRLVDWIEKGNNAFIHSQIYKSRLPQ
ncbi:hypothetical protein IWW34DRAFT_856242 [Fusarium oxysporum f. sp. albedinis]|nr:hypothetical protein IWW34DRAFT_856242 [Fusarium oxysporum f. sp. albedinis]KAJ0128910.1 hypothetical protein HZ326_27997 [Fusarium oxysporum f. sp. albedinis]KAK2470283.1 hypothetical protein H9L39_17900 [Fusarium oxysporum f. sp. albedinis]